MARAICNQCQKEFSWDGGRGLRLADVLSPCCHAAAHGKPSARPRPAKLDLPKIKAVVESAPGMWGEAVALEKPDWYKAQTFTVYLRPDGRVDLSRETWGHYTPDSAPVTEDGETWRVLRFFDAAHDHTPEKPQGYWYLRRLLEADYQRLLAIAMPEASQ